MRPLGRTLFFLYENKIEIKKALLPQSQYSDGFSEKKLKEQKK